jgi:DNA modification methylase
VRPYYDEAGTTIYHGDCREVLWDIAADVVVTDPPYGADKATWDQRFPVDALELAAFRTQAMGIIPGRDDAQEG